MLWLWDDERPRRSRSRGRTPAAAGVARISCVYTPPEQRGRRYGGAITAACSADALAREAERVVLFTDLDNPAPNKVYQRIGFRPVSDHRVVTPLRDPELAAHRCGRSFGCGVDRRLLLVRGARARRAARAPLAASFDDCLCPDCLVRAAAGTLPAPSTSAPSARTRRASSASEVTTRAPSAPRSSSSATISSSAALRPRREATTTSACSAGGGAPPSSTTITGSPVAAAKRVELPPPAAARRRRGRATSRRGASRSRWRRRRPRSSRPSRSSYRRKPRRS